MQKASATVADVAKIFEAKFDEPLEPEPTQSLSTNPLQEGSLETRPTLPEPQAKDIQPLSKEEEENISDFELAEMVADYYSPVIRTDGTTFYLKGPFCWAKLGKQEKQHWRAIKQFLRAKCALKPSRSKKRLMDVLACLHAEDSLYVPSEDWDSNPKILNTPLGIVDLTTGEMHERTPHDCVTKVTERSPVEGPTPKFDQFMNDIFSEEHWGEDAQEVREFVLNLLALSLSGEQIEQLFFFFYGSGANGKSVLLDLIRRILGDYAQTLDTKALTSGGSANKGYAIAGLRGVRLSTASELGRTDRWDEALLKQLTGDSHVAARQIYGEYGQVELQATLMVSGNHKPRFHGGDGGMVRRLVLIPFKASIPKDKQNRFLCDELFEEEGDAILSLLVKRCAEVRKSGLTIPKCIQLDTEEYVKANDDLLNFFEEYMEAAPDSYEPTSEVYEAFQHFKKQNGEAAMSGTAFQQEMIARFNLEKKRKRLSSGSNAVHVWDGVRLIKRKSHNGSDWQ